VFLLAPSAEKEFAQRADAATLAAFFDGILSTNRATREQAVELAKNRMTKDK